MRKPNIGYRQETAGFLKNYKPITCVDGYVAYLKILALAVGTPTVRLNRQYHHMSH